MFWKRYCSLVPSWMWLAMVALVGLPLYLRYFVFALGQCGVQFWMPRLPGQ